MKKLRFNSKIAVVLYIALAGLLFTACADVVAIDACRKGDPYGFLAGLWHGVIAPVSFVCSLFWDDVAMYAVNNNGGWYDFGFVVGAGILFGGSSRIKK